MAVLANERIVVRPTEKQRLLHFNQAFAQLMQTCQADTYSDIVLLCIGCDRSTGDALGPLVGSRLAHLNGHGITVCGTLDQPVHALNLDAALTKLEQYPRPFVIAIDASLGHHEDVGCIFLRPGGLLPGAGVGKKLPEVGHLTITAVVNVGGFLEQTVLQCTSLNLVNQLSKLISQGLHYYFHMHKPKQAQAII